MFTDTRIPVSSGMFVASIVLHPLHLTRCLDAMQVYHTPEGRGLYTIPGPPGTNQQASAYALLIH